MKELPFFKFSVQDWQNGPISILSDSLKGFYIDLCAFYWAKDCKVTEDELKKRFKTKSKSIQKLVESEAIIVQDGAVFILFLHQQKIELNQNKIKFSEWGKLGQKAKKSQAPL